MLTYNKEMVKYEKELRKNMTLWEIKLWTQFLRNYPIRFQRQKVIDNYIVDFYSVCEYIEREVKKSLPQSASQTAPSSEGARK